MWGLGLWVDLRGGFLAVRKGRVLVAKGGNSQRQLCKIYWLSASPACNLYLGRWSDIPNYALGRLSTIKQHLGIFFWCSYLNLSRPFILPYVSYGVSQQSPGINTIVSIVSHKTWATLRNSHNYIKPPLILIWSHSPIRVWQVFGLQWAFPDSFLGHCFMRRLK